MPTSKFEQLQFFFDEVLGELGWCDEIEASGIDPLAYVRQEIKTLQQVTYRKESMMNTTNMNKRMITDNSPIIAGVLSGELVPYFDPSIQDVELIPAEKLNYQAIAGKTYLKFNQVAEYKGWTADEIAKAKAGMA